MSMKANDHQSDSVFTPIDPIEPGIYPGRTIQILNIGLQKQREFKGEEKAPKIELMVTYELADEFLLDEDGNEQKDKPRWVSERFSINSLDKNQAKSTQRYKVLDPDEDDDGDWSLQVDKPCMITVVQNKSKKKDIIFNNVASIQPMRARDKSKAAPLVGEPKIFDFYEPDVEVFLSLPPFIQKIIRSALDFEGSELDELLQNLDKKEDKEEKPSKQKQKKKEPEPEEDNEEDDWDE